MNGSAIAGGTTQSISHTNMGEYTVRVTEDGCSVLSDKLAVAITSKEEVWADAVYPNPATDKLMVRINDTYPVQLRLIDISGKIVLHQKLTEPVNEIDLGNFSKGIYMLQLNQHTEKIIIE